MTPLITAFFLASPATHATAARFMREYQAGHYLEVAKLFPTPELTAQQRDKMQAMVGIELREGARGYQPSGTPSEAKPPKMEITGQNIAAMGNWQHAVGEQDINEFFALSTPRGPCYFSFDFTPQSRLIVVVVSLAKTPATVALTKQIEGAIGSALQKELGATMH